MTFGKLTKEAKRKTLDAMKRREIAESVIAGRKSGADMARHYNISQPTVYRIVAHYRTASSPVIVQP
ncbi:MAG TPA: helix-turn-helix domain-containing protein [Rhodopila sp.]|jgi:Mor family transcriptional regulator|nr:helix-turn-helix domain-containing protein [Rhodopila sp.]